MSDAVWIALALVLVIEGLMPAIHPAGWRRMFSQLLLLSDQHIRWGGLLSMVLGLLLLWALDVVN